MPTSLKKTPMTMFSFCRRLDFSRRESMVSAPDARIPKKVPPPVMMITMASSLPSGLMG